jgi:hypothetical protein
MESGQIFMIVIVALITACVTLSMFAQAWVAVKKPKGSVADRKQLEAIEARLSRMEEAIESVAVEMERVAEGQRFTARLLSERASPASEAQASRAAPHNDHRHPTPH